MSSKKILIFGKGFMGARLQEALNCSVSTQTIKSFNDAQKEINRYRPKIIINCIGYIGNNNVDDCEREIDRSLDANVYVPIILAEVCLRNNIKLIHISSGCIFHFNYKKQKPLTEKARPDFFELFYSRTKMYSERALEILSEKYRVLIVRIRIPLDDRPHPKNILDKLIGFRKVIDIPNSITYVPDFIQALKHLIKIDARGIFNVVNRGGLRYPRLMDIYQKYQPDFKYAVVKPQTVLKTPRTNLLLSTDKLEKSGFKVRKIQEVLEECVKNYLKRS